MMMKQDTIPMMVLQTRRALPVVLAALLQLMPLLRAVIPTYLQGAAPSAWAMVMRFGAGAVVALGSVHAISGASSGGVKINSASTATGKVGVAFTPYYITTTPFFGQAFTTSPNPPAPGLQIDQIGTNRSTGFVPGVIFGTPTQAGTYKITLQAYQFSNKTGGMTTALLTLTILPNGTLPIIANPLTNQIAVLGSTVTWVVGATDAQSYAWAFGGATIPDATNSTLQLVDVQTTNAGTYSVIVSSNTGSVTNSATLTVVGLPVITAQPQSEIALAGSDVALSVSANGIGLGYQWRFNGADLSQGTNLTLNLTNVTTAQSGTYSVVITNAAGPVTSADAQLLVVAPPSGSIAPRVSISPPRAGRVTLSFPTLAGYRYLLQSATTLKGTNWLTVTNLAPAFSASDPAIDAPLTPQNGSFYRVEVLSYQSGNPPPPIWRR